MLFSRRLLIAGLFAGLVFNVGGMLAAAIAGLGDTFAEYGVEPSFGAAAVHLGLRFGLGLAAMCFVAMTGNTDRGTLFRIATAVWFCAYVPGTVLLYELGFLTGGLLAFTVIWGAGETMLAVLAGAWYYSRNADQGQR